MKNFTTFPGGCGWGGIESKVNSTQLELELVEYVEVPVTIKLIPQTQSHQPLTRSLLRFQQESSAGPERLQVGDYYSALAETGEDFLLGKVKNIYHAGFVGLLMEKVPAEGSSELLYRHTDVAVHFGLESVHTSLLSIRGVIKMHLKKTWGYI